MGQIQRISLKDRARVGDVVRRSLESDPCVRYIARKGQVPQVFDGLMCPYWSSQPRELHLMTEGCKSVVVAHFHPSEEVHLQCCISPTEVINTCPAVYLADGNAALVGSMPFRTIIACLELLLKH